MIRSVLFTPATRLDRLPKAQATDADMIVLDLEDGVGPADKTAARDALSALAGEGYRDAAARLAVRINALSTGDGIRDMAMLLDHAVWPGTIVVPKVSAAAEVAQMVALSSGRGVRLLLTLESASGLAQAPDILRAAPDTALVGYGSADHLAETGGMMTAESLAWGRGQILNAAAIHGLPVLDGVCLDYRNTAALEAEAQLVKAMGFAGKIAIHPAQIPTINRVFSPTEEELADARAMIAASADAGDGAFSFNGKMVDAPVLARARRLMQFADRSNTE